MILNPFAASKSARLAAVRVPAVDARYPHPAALCMAADHFILHAIDEAGYEADELPPFALHFTDLWKYHGEWGNGGHAQYAGNTDNDFEAWARASELLGHMGLSRYREILDDFSAFVAAHEERIHDLYRKGEAMTAIRLFQDFDDRFAAAERDGPPLQDRLHAWLIAQPWLLVDEDAPPFSMQWLRTAVAPHPLAEKRKAARMRRRAAENRGEIHAFLRSLHERLQARREG
jgi:hypothetical protein